MMAIAEGGVESETAYQEIQEYLNVDSLITYIILNHYIGNGDWSSKNWYAGRLREPGARYKFFVWDAEIAIFNVWYDNTDHNMADTPQRLFHKLRDNQEFRLLFADHLHRHLFNGGALTPNSCIERYTQRSADIYTAIIGESARWGDNLMETHGGQPYTRDGDWIPSVNWIVNDFIPQRGEILLQQYRGIDLYPDTDAPVFTINGTYQHGGDISTGDSLSMTNHNGSGTVYYTLDGSDPRVPSIPPDIVDSVVLMPEDADKAVLIPTASNPADNSWSTDVDYNDSGWNDGDYIEGRSGGVGYENDYGYEPYISTDVHDDMFGVNASCYIRIPFTVEQEDLSGLDNLILKMRCDDGFVAYLNGEKVAGAHAPSNPRWNSTAVDSDGDSSSVAEYDLSDYIDDLLDGENLLAVHGMNDSAGDSSDFLISAELVAVEYEGGTPSSVSPTASPYQDAITLNETTTVKARVLDGQTWSALNEATYSVGHIADNLRITEIMYLPLEPRAEYVELQNVGTESLDLNMVRFANGIDFTFPSIILAPGERTVIVRDVAIFESQYGADVNVAGEYTGRLDNGGERIRVEDAFGQPIQDFVYEDDWYPITDGGGFSLTVIDPTTDDPDRWNSEAGWQPSAAPGGTPGSP